MTYTHREPDQLRVTADGAHPPIRAPTMMADGDGNYDGPGDLIRTTILAVSMRVTARALRARGGWATPREGHLGTIGHPRVGAQRPTPRHRSHTGTFTSVSRTESV